VNSTEVVTEAHTKLEGKLTDTLDDVLAKRQAFLCVLPKGHPGRCDHTPHRKMIKNETIRCKLDWIYTTPGDDDYIYKNRCNRLFPIVVPDELEKQWRNKTVKLKCAIPLREASTPFMMATAYLDYITLLLKSEGIEEFVDMTYSNIDDLQANIDIHSSYLSSYYGAYNRHIFDEAGFTMCPVSGDRIKAEHLANNDIKDSTAVQLGHVIHRSETQFTVRGKNILLMSREGNRLLGDHNLLEDTWLNRMNQITARQFALSNRSTLVPSQ
jgi:hypothetical protein